MVLTSFANAGVGLTVGWRGLAFLGGQIVISPRGWGMGDTVDG